MLAVEGRSRYDTTSGQTVGRKLLYESRSDTTLEEPDAIAISPRGGVVLCEDGDGGEVGGSNFIRVLTPAGKIETIARNDTPMDLEQYPGKSFAITGPWERGWL